MKVISIITLALALGLALTGCGAKEDTSVASPTADAPATKPTANPNKPAPQVAPPADATGNGAATVQPQ